MNALSSRDLKKTALEKLSGHWFIAMLVTFVASLLASDNVFSGLLDSGTEVMEDYDSSITGIIDTLPDFVLVIIAAFFTVAVIWGIVVFIIGGAVKLGHCLFYIKLCQDEEVRFGILFSRLGKLLKALGLSIMMGIFTFLWALLFIIPGIVAAYRYAMAPYIMAENPDIGVFEAIDASKKMMKGFKAELFMLHFSFIGWGILCLFTLGLGFIVLGPYVHASEAAFYLQLSRGGEPEPEVLLQ